MVDYRGYGKSEGKPSEKGLYLDAEAAYDFLRKKGKGPEDIIVYGFSLIILGLILALIYNHLANRLEKRFKDGQDKGKEDK